MLSTQHKLLIQRRRNSLMILKLLKSCDRRRLKKLTGFLQSI